MKYAFLITIFICLSASLPAQIKNINDYKSLISFQDELKTESAEVLVWGYFGCWGKYPNTHKYFCTKELDMKVYSKIKSSLDFKLFSDTSTIYYLPIKEATNLMCDYHEGDIIKMKVRLYRECKMREGKPFFLIEEIF